VVLLGKALHQSSSNDKDAADCCALLSTEAVRDVRSEYEDEETTETGHGAKDAESATGGMIEDYFNINQRSSL
jgi:hypothetical protein